MKAIIKNEIKGFSLLELLVYIMLSGLILSLISNSFHALTRPFNIINKKFSEEERLNNIEDKITTSINNNSLNGFIPLHFWHRQEELPYFITKRINSLSNLSRPGTNSIILELLDTEPDILLRTNYKDFIFEGAINKASLTSGGIKVWLSPEPLGNILINSKPTITFLSNNITKILFATSDLYQATNILSNSPQVLESNPSVLIPVRDHYLLFTSTANTLRRVSLISSENQPILEKVRLEKHPDGSNSGKCLISLEASDKTREASCKNNSISILKRLYAIDL